MNHYQLGRQVAIIKAAGLGSALGGIAKRIAGTAGRAMGRSGLGSSAVRAAASGSKLTSPALADLAKKLSPKAQIAMHFGKQAPGAAMRRFAKASPDLMSKALSMGKKLPAQLPSAASISRVM